MTDPNGLLYMRNRFYSPYLCRFVNPDPTGFSSGMNFFAYANGNPVSYLDPSGLGAIGENQNLSWLNTTTTSDGTLFGNNYNLSASTGTSSLFDTTSTTLNVAGIAQFGAEYGSGSAVLGLYTDAATSSGLYFNSSFWGGNQYVNTMQISDIAHGAGYVLFGATVALDSYGVVTGQQTPLAAEGDVSAGYIGLVGGPVGAAVGVTYGLFHNDINGAAAGSFQILTDWYYNAPFGPNFADLPNNP